MNRRIELKCEKSFIPNSVIELIYQAIENTKNKKGFSNTTNIGIYLSKLENKLSAQDYGFKSWGKLVRSLSNKFIIKHKGLKRHKIMVGIR